MRDGGIGGSAERLDPAAQPLPAVPEVPEVGSRDLEVLAALCLPRLERVHGDGTDAAARQAEDRYLPSLVPPHPEQGKGLPTEGVGGVRDGNKLPYL